MSASLDVLRASTFGKRTAEEEREQLRQYFVATEQWNRVFNGEVDIVYGAKGSGKSAIYSSIILSEDKLFDKNIIVVAAENPQGAPAFQSLSNDPPYDEFEFTSLWKLYILALVGQHLREFGLKTTASDQLLNALEQADLIPKEFTLAKTLKFAFDYVRKLAKRGSLETSVTFDPNTGMPSGITGKILLTEPTAAQSKLGILSIAELFEIANRALKETGFTFWVLLDRLDVAFADNIDLETAALRALFKCYLDIKSNIFISLKIFIRTDIWSAITARGFREASHIERSLTIDWRTDDLLNLVVRRATANQAICDLYHVNRVDILSSFDQQQAFLYRVLPNQVETGPNKPTTFNWLLSRTRDASQNAAPREVVHFLNELRTVQINRLERGMPAPPDGRLFDQAAFKEALPQVSKTRLEQTLYAEFPKLKLDIEALREQKATQTLTSLCTLWKADENGAKVKIAELESVGFLERIGTGSEISWRVPFLYRPALALLQGTADF